MTYLLLQTSCAQIGRHCEVCTYHHTMICCECGDALPPWHPDIEGLWKDGKVDGASTDDG